jgi:putative nucleotidyltransferase with HDIG domain
MTKMRTAVHLARRLSESVRATSVAPRDLEWVGSTLTTDEYVVWGTMQVMDRVHSIGVARRLVSENDRIERFEVAAALLHDVGKSQSGLGVLSRIAATLLGPRTHRWRTYLQHEAVGARMCRERDVDPRVCDLIEGRGTDEAQKRLRRADDL